MAQAPELPEQFPPPSQSGLYRILTNTEQEG